MIKQILLFKLSLCACFLHARESHVVNEFGEVVEEDFENGLTIKRDYDFLGRCTRLTLPDGSYVDYLYESLYLKAIQRFSSEGNLLYTHVYSVYSPEGEVMEMELIGSAGTLHLEYENGKARAIHTASWKEEVEAYDEKGNLAAFSVQDPGGAWSVCLNYDDQSQLIGETGAYVHTYAYDAQSNRLFMDEYPCTIEEDSRCRYDARDRLTAVELSEKSALFFTYDDLHRRLSKTLSTWDSAAQEWVAQKTVRYLYDGLCEIGAVDEMGKIVELRILGVGCGAEIGAAVVYELYGKMLVPIHDHRGSVCCLLDEWGSVAEYYRYSAFGNVDIFSSDGKRLSASLVGNPWLFCSKRLDSETGWVFFGRRYCDPSKGRWLTKDPCGAIDGPNPYVFTRNNPHSHIDFFGLFAFSDLRQTLWRYSKEVLRAAEALAAYCKQLRDDIGLHEVKHEWIGSIEKIFPPEFLQFAGFYSDHNICGTYYPGHEASDKVRITAINGILSARENMEVSLEFFSSVHGKNSIHFVFHPTDGWGEDLLNCMLVKFGYVSVRSQILAYLWKKLIVEMGGVEGGGRIIHYAHSIGATETFKASKLLTSEELKMIHVVTLGSPSLNLSSSGFASVENYVSLRDGVCYFDPLGYIGGALMAGSNVMFRGSLWGIPFIDHTLYSETYRDVMKELGERFIQTYGKKD